MSKAIRFQTTTDRIRGETEPLFQYLDVLLDDGRIFRHICTRENPSGHWAEMTDDAPWLIKESEQ